MNLSTFTSALFILFFLSLLASFSLQLPDTDFTPRLITASAFLLPFLVVAFLKLKSLQFNLQFSLWFNAPVILFVGLCFVLTHAYTLSINPGDALFDLLKIFILVSYLIFFIILLADCHDPLLWLSRILMLPLLLVISFAIYQAMVLKDDAEQKKIVFQLAYQFSSLLSNKNTFAEFLYLVLPFHLYGSFFDKGYFKYASLVLAFYSLVLIVVLKSFAVFLALAAVLFLCAFVGMYAHRNVIQNKYKLSPTRFSLSICMAFVFTLSILFFTFNGIDGFEKIKNLSQHLAIPLNDKSFNNTNSVYERLALWRNSMAMIQEHPLQGAGLANWKIKFPFYGHGDARYFAYDTTKFTRAHNDFIQVFAEAGILGLLCYFSIFAITVFQCLKKYLITKRPAWLFLVAGILGFFIISFFSFPMERMLVFIMFIIWLAVYVVLVQKEFNSRNVAVLKFFTVFCCLVIALCGLSISVSKSRITCEAQYNQMVYFKSKKKWQEMYSMAKKMDTTYFPLDYLATPVAWYQGAACYMFKKPQEAMFFYKTALQQAPYHVQVLNDIGVVYLNQGDNKNASAYFYEALNINPLFPDALFNQAILVYNSGNKYGAYKLIRRVKEIHQPDNYVETMIAVINGIADSMLVAQHLDRKIMELKNPLYNYKNLWVLEQKSVKGGTTFPVELNRSIDEFKSKN